MKRQPASIHRLLYSTARQAANGVEQWFLKNKLGITPLQFGALRSISREGTTLNELAHHMMLKPPSILPTIDLLENRGDITRRADPHDRRKIHLRVTAKGKRLVGRVGSARRSDPLTVAFKKMSVKKRSELISLFTELNEGMAGRN